eukprot:166265_1
MSNVLHSTPDDLSFTRPAADHGTVGAVASRASDLSYDLSGHSSDDDDSIVLNIQPSASKDKTDIGIPDGLEVICSKSRDHIDHKCSDRSDPDCQYADDEQSVEEDHNEYDDGDNDNQFADDDEPTLENIAEWITSGKIERITILSGAGVSCSAGIPDFRTPGSGLYDNLEKYNLPYPEAVFDLDFYASNPQPFVDLARELWPGTKHSPTITHSFIALLDKKGLLLRNYTQNIDGLELMAGVKEEKIVECHGHFRTSSCINCGVPHDGMMARDMIVLNGKAPLCKNCGSLVKPDIVFFGESLPVRFKHSLHGDLGLSDLLIVMGTSLKVAPVSLIPEMIKSTTPRVLFNKELVGDFAPPGTVGNHRDVFESGDVDDSVRKLAALLGWEDELLALNEETRITTA